MQWDSLGAVPLELRWKYVLRGRYRTGMSCTGNWKPGDVLGDEVAFSRCDGAFDSRGNDMLPGICRLNIFFKSESEP